MNKYLIAIGTIALFGAGIFIGGKFFPNVNEQPAMPNVSPLIGLGDSVSSSGAMASFFAGEIIEVQDGQSIQDAVGKAKSGDLIRVYPGTYKETVYIDKDSIALQGVIRDGKWPVLDGGKELNDGILYSGSGILIENFKIINYKGNGIMGQAGNNFVIRNNWVIDTGVYGIFPEFGKNGVIDHNVLSGIEDAAIYVGMCDNIDVRNNEVFNSVAGIEIENCRYSLVEDNYVHNNTGGILVFITPGLPIKTCAHTIVRDNFIINNNHENFAQEGSIVASLPQGTGIIVMAADDVIIENNIISGNDNVGIVITDLNFGAQASKDPDSEPNPDRIIILDNLMTDNGKNPVKDVKIAMATKFSSVGPDVLAVGKSSGCFRNKAAYRTFGVDGYARCEHPGTADIRSYLLREPIKPRDLGEFEKGKLAYYGVCSGCHAYDIRMIGPPTQVIQALYKGNPKGLADYITNPVRKREDYPEMPPQSHLSEETRLAVANYLLNIEGHAPKGMGRYNYHKEAK